MSVGVVEQVCVFCGGGPEAAREGAYRGCLIAGLDAEDTEVWYHRVCAEQAEAT